MRGWSSEGAGPHTIAARLKRLLTLFTWEQHDRAELASNLGKHEYAPITLSLTHRSRTEERSRVHPTTALSAPPPPVTNQSQTSHKPSHKPTLRVFLHAM